MSTDVEETIKQAANDVEDYGDHTAEGDFLDPSRYWMASTLCPLLAGTFGPVASGFSICALVHHWRVYIPTGDVEEHAIDIDDPKWLLAVNAISLAAALVGNASLLLNMGRRLRFSIAQPITIVGFFLAGVLLIADMAALTAPSDDRITDPLAQPPDRHALTSAFYYAIFATVLYMLIAVLMCITVWGAHRGYYEKDFRLTMSQRTLMLQTMTFVAYLLLGALVYSHIEGWDYLDAVYWADVTMLTVGLGDYSPATDLGRGLLFPFAIGGIVILGLVVGSIRTLVLERGKEKMTARIIEKRRDTAVSHVDFQAQTIRIGMFAKAAFIVRPDMSPAQRREEEFRVMRTVQEVAQRQRRYTSLALSGLFALTIWFVGAAVFMVAEHAQQWTYLESLYFAYTSLLTIGYGTPFPQSNAGKPFFVIWSLLAVPSLTILISNMGDTVIKWISDLTIWIGSITVLPGESGFRATIKTMIRRLHPATWVTNFSPPGFFGDVPRGNREDGGVKMSEFEERMLDRMADRVSAHFARDELEGPGDDDIGPHVSDDERVRDVAFYHYVLSRECRNLLKDVARTPPKKYAWADWEYYIKLMGSVDDHDDAEAPPRRFPGQRHADLLVPDAMAMRRRDQLDADALRRHPGPHSPDATPGPGQDADAHPDLRDSPTWLMPWSWLSNQSPLMAQGTEADWILERLSAALERELNRSRRGFRRKPPISYRQLRRHARRKKAIKDREGDEGKSGGGASSDSAEDRASRTEVTNLEKAEKSSA